MNTGLDTVVSWCALTQLFMETAVKGRLKGQLVKGGTKGVAQCGEWHAEMEC